jgi:hypothetical protein
MPLTSVPTQSATGGLERIYDALQSILPGALMPMIQLAVWDAVEEFCVRSTFWRDQVNWSMEPGDNQYDLNPLTQEIRVAWVLNTTGLVWFKITPTAILTDLGDTSQLRMGTAWVVLKPSGLGAILPPWLDDWSEAIRDGAICRLCSQPARPYSEPKLALYHSARFRSQIQLARVEAQRMVPAMAPLFPYFARGRRNNGLTPGWGGMPGGLGTVWDGDTGTVNGAPGGGSMALQFDGPGNSGYLTFF